VIQARTHGMRNKPNLQNREVITTPTRRSTVGARSYVPLRSHYKTYGALNKYTAQLTVSLPHFR